MAHIKFGVNMPHRFRDTPLDAVWHHAINMKSRTFSQHGLEMIQIEFGEN